MAFTGLNTLGSTNSSSANQTLIQLNVTADAEAGHLVVAIVAVDNNQTTDGDEGAVTSVIDGGSNTWVKGAEFTNGQGSAQAGATCSIWYSLLSTTLVTGGGAAGVIQVNFSNSASRDKSAVTVYEFSVDAGSTVAVEGTPGTLANDGADPGSLNVTTSNIECLRVRGIAAESNTATDLTQTTNWTRFTPDTTAGGASAANMGVRGEFHISTGTGDASDPTLFAADCASVYVAFKEVAGAATFIAKSYITTQAVQRAAFW